MKRSKVYLVGAGPGDPGLLTLKARDLIAAADCVIYDYLVNPAILEHAPASAELIYVGKRGTEISWTQGEINRLLVEKAKEHAIVVRLKGGDPFIFGRGGEEAEVLVAAGIEWEVVPGVSAGSAVAIGAAKTSRVDSWRRMGGNRSTGSMRSSRASTDRPPSTRALRRVLPARRTSACRRRSRRA